MKDSDGSEIVIEVLCKHSCRRLPFVYDSYDVDCGFQVSGRHSQCHRRDFVDWISRVPTQIWSTIILNMCLILRPICVESLKVKVVFLYSAVSSPLDRSKRFTLFAFPDRPVHSDTVLGFSGKHSSHAAITRND